MVRLAARADPTLDVIVATLTRVAGPTHVFLFGSRASGTAREDSDYDLLVVFPDGTDLDRERRLCYDALRAVPIYADVLVRTESEHLRRRNDAGFIDWLVAREGKVLYSTRPLDAPSPGARVHERGEGAAHWRERAAADLREAQMSADSATPVPDAICFHAHAAIEKLLKARIVDAGTFPPKTHDLAQLLALQAPNLRADAALASACTVLQALYPKSRYPEQPMPTLDEARTALMQARIAVERL